MLIVQLLDPNLRRQRYLYAIAGLQLAFAIPLIFIVFLMCNPTAKLWDTTLPGSCLSPHVLNDYSYWLSAYTTLLDIIMAVVPIARIGKLKMSLWSKIGICVMMGLTLLSAIVTVVKATYLDLFNDTTDPR